MRFARIVAALARLVRDVGLAEELAQDAVLAALEEWPVTGFPANPGGWLMLTAKHRAIDRLRRDDRLAVKVRELGHDVLSREPVEGLADFDVVLDPGVEDDLLRLIFTACHPALTPPSQVALSLRVLGGLSTKEIARAFLVPEATIAQRIVRAKRTLAEERIPFEIPPVEEQAQRLQTVLGVVYLIFNEGYTATAGEGWARPELCHEALRLARMLAAWAPAEAEVHGLAALLEIQSSRLPARVGRGGAPVPLLEQNRGRWDQLLIRRGFTALLRAHQAGPPGPYVLQAGIAACHAQARRAEDNRLAPDRRPLRPADPAAAGPGRAPQPGGRGRYGPGTCQGTEARGRDPWAGRLPPAAVGPGRPARPARPHRGGRRRAPPSG